MNHHQQQSVDTISIKVTLVATNENRFIALPSPPSFTILVKKIATVFDNRETMCIHYVDDESDRVTVSSSDELACALSLLPTGRALRLFVSTASTEYGSTPPQQVPIQEPTDVPTTGPATDTTATYVDDKPEALNNDIKAEGEMQAIDVLKGKLSQEAGIVVGVDVCEKRCLRVLARFGGDVDKAVTALERCHQRNQLKKQTAPRPDSPQPESLRELRQARRAERLAARLALQEKKQLQLSNAHSVEAKKGVDSESVEALALAMADLGLVVAKGRCTGALRRADGNVDAAKAQLVNWCAKRQERLRDNANKTTTAPSKDQETVEGDDADKEKLLAQLDQMGLGAPTDSSDKKAERIRKRNERLLKKLKGDVDQVVCLLKARNAKVEERMAARKARQAERPRGRRNEETFDHLLTSHYNAPAQ